MSVISNQETIRIVILDSGLDPASPAAKDIGFTGGLGFYSSEAGEVFLRDDVVDDLGHGTAVTDILRRMAPDAKLIPVRVLGAELCGSEVLLEALHYIEQQIPCDLINISLGLTCCDCMEELEAVCRRLYQRGTIIVSAFDNRGAISYPAAYECVLGIDAHSSYRKKENFCFLDGSVVDVIGFNIEHRVAWLHGGTQMVSGTSFSTPHFTAAVANLMAQGVRDFEQIKGILRERARDHKRLEPYRLSGLPFQIERAVAFPFNKEMHSLARFRSQLQVKNIKFYDSKYTGQVGKPISSWQWPEESNSDVIHNIEHLRWDDDFDTIVLGHIQEIERLTGRLYSHEILQKCAEFGKKLYAFYDIRPALRELGLENALQWYVPLVEPLPHQTLMHKGRVAGVPVIGVMGTCSRQGKFTLQLALRKALQEMGYHVGQIGTEPSSLLFGMDAIFPIGYESTVQVHGEDAALTINLMMGCIEDRHPDLILFGAQGQTVPLQPGGIQEYTTRQHELILGAGADAYLLSVGMQDDHEYIERTIQYLQSVYPSRVLALVLSPMQSTLKWSILSGARNIAPQEQVETCRLQLEKRFGLPVFTLRGHADATGLATFVVDALSEEIPVESLQIASEPWQKGER